MIHRGPKMQISPLAAVPVAPQAGKAAPLADKLEQAFLEQMMQYAFPRPDSGAFSGGIGEEQFASFMSREYAAILSGALDLGLAPVLEKRE